MKRNPLIYLGIVLVIGVLVWLIERPELPRQGVVKSTELFKDLKTDLVEKIEIEHLINGIELTKEGTDWKVSEFKTELRKKLDAQEKKGKTGQPETPEENKEFYDADTERVQRLLDTVKNLNVETVISTNPKKHAEFQVTNIGLQIRMFDAEGNKLAHLYIGKTSPDFINTYIRKDGEDNVYLVRQYIGPQFTPEIDRWKKKEETPDKGETAEKKEETP